MSNRIFEAIRDLPWKKLGKYALKSADPRTYGKHIDSPFKRWLFYTIYASTWASYASFFWFSIPASILIILATGIAMGAYFILILNNTERMQVILGSTEETIGIFGWKPGEGIGLDMDTINDTMADLVGLDDEIRLVEE